MRQLHYVVISLAAGLASVSNLLTLRASTPENLVNDPRQSAWAEFLDHRDLKIPVRYYGLIESLKTYRAGATIHVVLTPPPLSVLSIRFYHEKQKIIEVRGHTGSAFTSSKSRLYFAEFGASSAGCKVVAYDTVTGKKLWSTKLHQVSPGGHSGYKNSVALRLSNDGEIKDGRAGDAIIITGVESFVRYGEVLDSRSGESLAVKNYQVGY